MNRFRNLAIAAAVLLVAAAGEPAAATPSPEPPQPTMNALLNYDPHAVNPLHEELMAALPNAEWLRIGDRNYPPHYFYSMGRYPVAEEDVQKMREAIAGIPRVDAESYDLLFNAIAGTWDVVKWVALPEPMGALEGYGHMSAVVLEPVDVYSIPARHRDPSTLGDFDWTALRRWCTTTRGGDALNEDLRDSDRQRLAAAEAERADAEQDLASWMHNLLRKMRDESGYGDLSPEEMARRTGTDANEWRDRGHPGDA